MISNPRSVRLAATATVICFLLMRTPPLGFATAGDTFQATSIAGKVEGERGRPVRGATVVIYSASPATSSPVMAGRNHRECGSNTITDKNGYFKIEGLRDDLRYRLLVVDELYEPTFVADSRAPTSDLRIALAPRRLKTLAVDDQIVRGTLVDSKGKPVAGAIVEPRGFTRGDSGMVGPMREIAALTVSDELGQFYIETAKPVDTLELAVRAPGFAPQYLSGIRAGRKGQSLTLVRGVTVQGRLVRDGHPIGGAILGICPVLQTASNYVGPWETLTQPDGTFAFENVTAGEEMSLYGVLESLNPFGALPVLRTKTGMNESTMDVGELHVGVGHKLAVHVKLPNEEPLPADARLMIWQDATRDVFVVAANGEGIFEAERLPSGLYRIGMSVADWQNATASSFRKKYRPAKKIQSLDESRPGSLLGRIDQDLIVELEMERGDSTVPWSRKSDQDANLVRLKVEELRELPLRGVSPDTPAKAVAPK